MVNGLMPADIHDAIVAVCAAPRAPIYNLRILVELRYCHYPEAVSGQALVAACKAGGGARAALFVRELSCKPFCAHKCDRALIAHALRMACASGSAEAVDVLGAEPYSLGHDQAIVREGCMGVLEYACQSGCVAVVDALARPPFSVSRTDMLDGRLGALVGICAELLHHAIGAMDSTQMCDLDCVVRLLVSRETYIVYFACNVFICLCIGDSMSYAKNCPRIFEMTRQLLEVMLELSNVKEFVPVLLNSGAVHVLADAIAAQRLREAYSTI
eukprot:m51a1_g11253 hypothetical protein (271) ;mRNA; f:47244-49321